MLSTCKEREAAFEFMVHMASGQRPGSSRNNAGSAGPKSLRRSGVQDNRFFKVAIAEAANWWMPPFAHKHWDNTRTKDRAHWQQALRQEITVTNFHTQAAKFLRGEG